MYTVGKARPGDPVNGYFFLLLLSPALLSSACAGAPPKPATGSAERAVIEGTAGYRERIALPPNAVFEATLEEVSKAGAPAEIIGRSRVEPAGQVPIHFEIPYEPSRILERNSYSVRGRISVGGKLWFTTDTLHPVLPRGHSGKVDLLLRRVSGGAAAEPQPGGKTGGPVPDASLLNTYWRLVRLGEDAVAPAEGRREPRLLLREEGGRKRYSATAGCNQLSGGCSVDGETIRFAPGATTLMACPPPLDALERNLKETLDAARRWRVRGDALELFDGAGRPIARFEAVCF